MFRGKALYACAVLWGAWSFAQPFSKAPLYYQEALRAFKKARKSPFRIQVMEDFQNAQLFAMLAFQAVQGRPQNRCIIIVANQEVASATAEHLAEHNVEASTCFHQSLARPYQLDPSKQVIICSAFMSSLFHQQFFNLKIIGRSAPTRPSESSYVCHGSRISAKREVQVAPAFSTDLDVDYQYTMEQAHADGLTSSFEGLMLPLPFYGNTKAEGTEVIAKLLAKVIKARHDWTPMVLYVNTVPGLELNHLYNLYMYVYLLFVRCAWPSFAWRAFELRGFPRQTSSMQTRKSPLRCHLRCSFAPGAG